MRDFLYLAPLQSFTDHPFRNAFQQTLGDVDRFYAPYLKLNNDGTIKPGPKLDILLENNPFEIVVPQLMACCSADFLLMANYIESLGYTEVNWNLGCPYPMVAKRDLGSGILNKPEKIIQILEEVIPKTKLNIGIKMRMGYEDTSDILSLLPQLNDFELTEIIVHARYGKQLYKGNCDLDRFGEILSLTKHQLAYNGDITSVADFRMLKQQFPTINHWMIGRGAISNPFIFEMIQENSDEFPEDWAEIWIEFQEILVENLMKKNENDGNVLQRLIHYWDYFSEGIPEGKHIEKKLKKIDSIEKYLTTLSDFYLAFEDNR